MGRLTLGKLSQIRVKAGFSSAEKASKRLGCSRHWVWVIEQGRVNLPREMADRMADTYRVSAEEILNAHRADVLALLRRRKKAS